MTPEADLAYQGAPVWRVTPDIDGSIPAGRISYRIDVGIRRKLLIGCRVEANLSLLVRLLETLLEEVYSNGMVGIAASSWLEDLGARASDACLGIPYEATNLQRGGSHFLCECPAGLAPQVIRALWSSSSELTVEIPAKPPLVSRVEFTMLPDHFDTVNISMLVEDEPFVRNLFSPAAQPRR